MRLRYEGGYMRGTAGGRYCLDTFSRQDAQAARQFRLDMVEVCMCLPVRPSPSC